MEISLLGIEYQHLQGYSFGVSCRTRAILGGRLLFGSPLLREKERVILGR